MYQAASIHVKCHWPAITYAEIDISLAVLGQGRGGLGRFAVVCLALLFLLIHGQQLAIRKQIACYRPDIYRGVLGRTGAMVGGLALLGLLCTH